MSHESEKRRGARKVVCVLAHLERNEAEKKRSALVSDLSATGLHLLTREHLEPGDKVQLELHLGNEQKVEVTGKVVRILERPPERSTLWTLNAGVEFDAPQPALIDALAKLPGEK